MSALPSPELLWARLLGHVAGHDAAPVHRAYGLARLAHADQWRDGKTEPYVAHPLRVALIVAQELGRTEPLLLCTALLHDVLEDSQVPRAEIERLCGPEVAAWVARLSKWPVPSTQKEARDAAYYAALAEGPPEVRLVKGADRVDNLRSMRTLGQPLRLQRYLDESRRHILPLTDDATLRGLLLALCETDTRPL